MAEAVLASKNEKELPCGEAFVVVALGEAVLARLAKNFLVSYRPGNAGNWDGQHKKPDNLQVKRHFFKMLPDDTSLPLDAGGPPAI